MNCSAVTSPSWNGEPVSSSTSHAWPTLCIQVPISETSCPLQKRRKSRWRRAARRAGSAAHRAAAERVAARLAARSWSAGVPSRPPRPRSPGAARPTAARPRPAPIGASARSVASVRNSRARSPCSASVAASRAAPRTGHVAISQSAPAPGMLLEVPVAREHRRGGRGAPAGQAGEAVRAVAHQGEPVGNGRGRDAELLPHARLVALLAPPPIELDHPLAPHALRQVLVRRADDDLLHPRIGRRDRRRRGQGVVGLELDHGPDDHAQRAQRLLERLELRVQQRVHPLAGLVARPERVAERLDDVIGGHAQMRRAALEHAQDRRDDAPNSQQLLRPAAVEGRPRREEVAEELVGAVDEVHDHSQNDTTGPWPDAVESTPP